MCGARLVACGYNPQHDGQSAWLPDGLAARPMVRLPVRWPDCPLARTSVCLPSLPRRRQVVDLADRKNMAFLGTLVRRGRGRALVSGTAVHSEFEKVFHMLQASDGGHGRTAARLQRCRRGCRGARPALCRAPGCPGCAASSARSR